MNSKQLKTLYRKEILDVIRDKKTILTMVVLPIVLYPLLFLVIMQVISMINTTTQEKTYYIAYENVAEADREVINNWISGDEDDLDYAIKCVESENVKKDLEDETINAYITTQVNESQTIYEIHYLSAITDSMNVSDMLEEEIEAYAKKLAEENAKEAGLDVNKVLYPVTNQLIDASSNESSMGSILGSVIPFLLITSILMGSMYPAIDSTAGEKERGTLETLLTLPIGNIELIMSKFLSVATIAVVSVLINVLSMGGIAVYLFTTISSLSEQTVEFDLGSFIPAILISLVCIIAFALFMSALVMCVCAFAKSFKEANNYITPLTLVVMLTAYIGFIPNIELDKVTAVIPVANVCLLMKNLLIFKFDFSLIMLVLFSNVLYAFVSVWFLAKIYNSESILFGESMAGIKLFERRKNIKKGSLPSITEGLLVLIIAMLLMVYLGGMMSLENPIMGVIIPQLFIGLLPILACIYIKSDLKKVFAIKLPSIKNVIGAVILMIGGICLSLVISNIIAWIFPKAGENLNAEYMMILDGVPFGVALLLIALTPAICEELMFRGYLFTAARQKMSLLRAVLLVSLLFGISHMSLIKLLPTMVIGMLLAYAMYSANSIFISAIMHFMNNALSVVILYYGDNIPFLNDEKLGTPIMIAVIVVAVVTIPLGMKILQRKQIQKEI